MKLLCYADAFYIFIDAITADHAVLRLLNYFYLFIFQLILLEVTTADL